MSNGAEPSMGQNGSKQSAVINALGVLSLILAAAASLVYFVGPLQSNQAKLDENVVSLSIQLQQSNAERQKLEIQTARQQGMLDGVRDHTKVLGEGQSRQNELVLQILNKSIDEAYQQGARDGRVDEQISGLRGDVSTLGKADLKLDESLQREMRLLDAAAEARINEFDRRVQGELATVASQLRSAIDTLNEILDGNNDQQAVNRENIARLQEQIQTVATTLQRLITNLPDVIETSAQQGASKSSE